jgi:hypothetical protein
VVLLGAAAANPAVGVNAICSTVDKLVTKANQEAAATSFCSSYLHIPVYTTTVTSAGVAVTTTATITSGETSEYIGNPVSWSRTIRVVLNLCFI